MHAGGKRFRPLFTLVAAGVGADPDNDDVITAAAVVELIHLATLYHDDVMDEADLRRGAKSANAQWDNKVAILTGDYLFAHASRLVAGLGPDAVRIIAETFAELVTGQTRETVGPAPGEDPIEHHLKVLDGKTASLIDTCARYAGMFSKAEPEHVLALRGFGRAIGTAFQISDDIIDITSENSGKTPGTDLREGVPTLPVFYTLADTSADPRLVELVSGADRRRRGGRRGGRAPAGIGRPGQGQADPGRVRGPGRRRAGPAAAVRIEGCPQFAGQVRRRPHPLSRTGHAGRPRRERYADTAARLLHDRSQ